MTEVEVKKPQESLQDRLAQVVELLHRHKLVEDLTHRQEGQHHDLVENLVHRQNLAELQRKLDELRSQPGTPALGISWEEEIRLLEAKIQDAQRQLYSNLTPWQRVQLARHPRRPYTLDYIQQAFSDFEELHGDRLFGDDRAVVGGFAILGGKRVVVIGTQKGRDTKENILRNFGSAHPEGYRKALRLMKLAGVVGVRIKVTKLEIFPDCQVAISAECGQW